MSIAAAISISLTAAVFCPWGACGQEVLEGGKQPQVLADFATWKSEQKYQAPLCAVRKGLQLAPLRMDLGLLQAAAIWPWLRQKGSRRRQKNIAPCIWTIGLAAAIGDHSCAMGEIKQLRLFPMQLLSSAICRGITLRLMEAP